MADVPYIEAKQVQAIEVTHLKKAVLLQAVVSLDDTITIKEVSTLTVHDVRDATDGSAVAHTVADNIITITEDPYASKSVFVFVVE